MASGRTRKTEATRIGTGDRSTPRQQRETARGFLWELLPMVSPDSWADLETVVLPVYAAYYREVMPPSRREDWTPAVFVGKFGRLKIYRPTIERRWLVLGGGRGVILLPEDSDDWNAGGDEADEAIRAANMKLYRENMPDVVVDAIVGWARRWNLAEDWVCDRVNADLRRACDHRGGQSLDWSAPELDPYRHIPYEPRWPWEPQDDPPRELWAFEHHIKIDGYSSRHHTASEWKKDALAEAMQAISAALDEHIAAVQAESTSPKTLEWPQARDHLTWLLMYQVGGLSYAKVADSAGRSTDAVREGIDKARELVELAPRAPKRGRPRSRRNDD